MKSLNNKGDGTTSGHLLSQMKFPVLELGFIHLNCWPKRSHRNP